MSSAIAHTSSPQNSTRTGNGNTTSGVREEQAATPTLGRPLARAQDQGRKDSTSESSDVANGNRRQSNTADASSTPTSWKRNGELKEDAKKTKKRRKVNHACVYCRRSHMTCDQARPCSRCIKRDIGHLCHDEPREPKKQKAEGDTTEVDGPISPAQKTAGVATSTLQNARNSSETAGLVSASQPVSLPTTAAPENLMTMGSKATAGPTFDGSQQVFNDWNHHLPYQDMHNYHPSYMFNTSEVGNEYMLLNDFLSHSLFEDSALYQGEDPQALLNDPSFTNMLGSGMPTTSTALLSNNVLGPSSRSADGTAISRPPSRLRAMDQAQEKYYMIAADPAGTEPPEERMNKLLKAKYDAGLLKPFNYVKGYARLNQYMETHLHPRSRQHILRQLEAFRPKFRERMQSLTDVELIRVEMWFEMKLMEYDRVFASMAIPACCWRRTGEIFRGNREMAELIGVPLEQLREGKRSIHDIIGEDSLVMYWTKFGQIAFDASKKAMLASCTLKRQERDVKDKDREMKCCFSFTVQRDEHQIPSIIIGNFLPIDPVEP